MAEFPAPSEGLLLTYLVVSCDVARSRRFYTEVLGGEAVLDTDDFAIVAIANGWVTITGPGAPTPDKPNVTLEPPSDLGRVSGFMNIRVANIGAAYPSLLDPTSPTLRPGGGTDLNFQYSGAQPYLYYTRLNEFQRRGSDRDVVRWKLSVAPSTESP